MKAYHGKQEIKDLYVNRMKAHIKADELIQGVGFQNGRGCAIGCTLNNYSHAAFEEELDVPQEIAYLIEDIFEGLIREESQKFALGVLEAIPVGADTSLVVTKFKLWLLKDKQCGAYQYADEQGKNAINTVATLLKRELAGVKVSRKEWDTAAAAAWAAAADAANAADAYAAAANAAARRAQAKKLIQLLKESGE